MDALDVFNSELSLAARALYIAVIFSVSDLLKVQNKKVFYRVERFLKNPVLVESAGDVF